MVIVVHVKVDTVTRTHLEEVQGLKDTKVLETTTYKAFFWKIFLYDGTHLPHE